MTHLRLNKHSFDLAQHQVILLVFSFVSAGFFQNMHFSSLENEFGRNVGGELTCSIFVAQRLHIVKIDVYIARGTLLKASNYAFLTGRREAQMHAVVGCGVPASKRTRGGWKREVHAKIVFVVKHKAILFSSEVGSSFLEVPILIVGLGLVFFRAQSGRTEHSTDALFSRVHAFEQKEEISFRKHVFEQYFSVRRLVIFHIGEHFLELY